LTPWSSGSDARETHGVIIKESTLVKSLKECKWKRKGERETEVDESSLKLITPGPLIIKYEQAMKMNPGDDTYLLQQTLHHFSTGKLKHSAVDNHFS
jgi:hypothetical protein